MATWPAGGGVAAEAPCCGWVMVRLLLRPVCDEAAAGDSDGTVASARGFGAAGGAGCAKSTGSLRRLLAGSGAGTATGGFAGAGLPAVTGGCPLGEASSGIDTAPPAKIRPSAPAAAHRNRRDLARDAHFEAGGVGSSPSRPSSRMSASSASPATTSSSAVGTGENSGATVDARDGPRSGRTSMARGTAPWSGAVSTGSGIRGPTMVSNSARPSHTSDRTSRTGRLESMPSPSTGSRAVTHRSSITVRHHTHSDGDAYGVLTNCALDGPTAPG